MTGVKLGGGTIGSPGALVGWTGIGASVVGMIPNGVKLGGGP
jgi:hypothetical protein